MPALGAKLRIPVARRALVARVRLTGPLARLTDGEDAGLPRLVLVAAPAGFGKTTLLTQWLAHDDGASSPRVAWLSLDAADSDLRRFLRHLVAAVRVACLDLPGVGAEAAALAEADRVVAEDVLVSLVNDVDAHVGAAVVALDDYHVVDDADVHAAVGFLVDNLPPQVTVAMTTRVDPPLPLARLRARGELLEVRAADLRFTEDEAAAFLNTVMGLDLSAEHVAALERRTEGWAAGLQLAALYARNRTSEGADLATAVADVAGTHRFILDYLLEEVLDQQPDDVRDFLLETSVLDELTGDLCDAVTGRSGSQQVLEALERAHLFVIALDDVRTQWRYHHLFADALRSRLTAGQPDRAELHRRAAGWYAARGRLGDAVPHALASGDHELTGDLVELAVAGLRKQRQDRTLRTWLDAIPSETVVRRPLLAAHTAWAHLTRGDLDGVDGWLDAADEALAAGPSPRAAAPVGVPGELEDDRADELAGLPALLATYRAAAAQARGDVAATIAHASRALDVARPTDHLSRGAAGGFLGLTAWAGGDLATGVATFGAAVEDLRAAGNAVDALGAVVVLGAMQRGRGQLHEARRIHEQALADAAARPGPAAPVLGDLHVGLAEVLRELGELDAAAHHLGVARELGESASLPEHRHRWFTTHAGLLRSLGDHEAALVALDEAARTYVPGFLPDVRPIPAQRARCLVSLGRGREARAWADGSGVTWDDASYLAEYDQLTLARLLVLEHADHPDVRAVEDCRRRLSEVVVSAEATGRGGSLVDSLVVAALLDHATGDERRSVATLERALVTGVPAGHRQLFLDEGEPMRMLLRAVATSGADGAVRTQARELLEAGALAGTRRAATPVAGLGARPLEDLSSRELEVMRLLATTLTGPEIARHLFVSINTLRTHTKHIFTKLDVTTRRAAVRRAEELGLL
jgi:LuxR family maltose regulon positive regulatory protein